MKLWLPVVKYFVTIPYLVLRLRWNRSLRIRCQTTSRFRYRSFPGPSEPPPSRIFWRNLKIRRINFYFIIIRHDTTQPLLPTFWIITILSLDIHCFFLKWSYFFVAFSKLYVPQFFRRKWKKNRKKYSSLIYNRFFLTNFSVHRFYYLVLTSYLFQYSPYSFVPRAIWVHLFFLHKYYFVRK